MVVECLTFLDGLIQDYIKSVPGKIKDTNKSRKEELAVLEKCAKHYYFPLDELGFDYEGLTEHVKRDLLEAIHECIQETNLEKKCHLEETTISRACEFATVYHSCEGKKREYVEQFLTNCIYSIRDYWISKIPVEQKAYMSKFAEDYDANRRHADEQEKTENKKDLHTRMERKLISAYDRERNNNPSYRMMHNYSKDLMPVGILDVLKTTVTFDSKPDTLKMSEQDALITNEFSVQKAINYTREKENCADICLYGKGGQGKTIALLHLSLRDSVATNKRGYCVFVPLRSLEGSIADYILHATFGGERDLYQTFVEEYQEKHDLPPILLILDGFNEITKAKRAKIKNEIEQLKQHNIQFLITSRYDVSGELDFSSRMVRLSLEDLERQQVEKYLEMNGISLPDKKDPVWKLLTTPLMLYLYILSEKEVPESSLVVLQKRKNAGALIWNYIQQEINRVSRSGENMGTVAVLSEYIAPFIAFQMVQDNNKFSISLREMEKYLRMSSQAYKKDKRNSVLLDDLTEKVLKDPKFQQDILYETLVHDLCLFVELSNSVQFVHQHFRDALAALFLYQKATSDLDMMVNFLTDEPYQYVFDYLIDYNQAFDLDGKHSWWTTIWDHYRNNHASYSEEINGVFLEKMLELYRRSFGSDISDVEFGDMDLSRVSLQEYKLTNSRNHFVNSTITRRTFCGEGHSMRVCEISYVKNGTVFSASNDTTMRLWNMKTKKNAVINSGLPHKHYLRCAQVCPTNEKRLVSAGDDKTVFLWNLHQGEWRYKTLGTAKDWIYSISWAKNGSYVVYGDRSGNIRSVELSGAKQREFSRHSQGVRCIKCAKNNLFASGDEGGLVCIWDAGDSNPICTFNMGKRIKSIHWLHDDDYIAILIEDGVFILDYAYLIANPINIIYEDYKGIVWKEDYSKACIASFRSFQEDDYICIFTLNSISIKKCSYSNSDNMTRLQVDDVASGSLNIEESGVVSCASWDNSCKNVVFATKNGSVWNCKLFQKEVVSERLHIQRISEGNTNSARCSAWSDVSAVLAAGYDDGYIRLWDVKNQRCRHVIKGHYDSVKCIAWEPCAVERFVSGSDDGSLKIWRISGGDPETLISDGSPINDVIWLSNDRIVAVTDEDGVLFCNPQTRKVYHSKEGHTKSIYSVVSCSTDNVVATAGNDMHICLWDITDFSCIKFVRNYKTTHREPIRGLAFNPMRNILYSGANDGQIFYRHFNSKKNTMGQDVHDMPRFHNDFIYGITISKNNKYVISCSPDMTIGIWDATNDQFLAKGSDHMDFLWDVSPSPRIKDKYFFSSSSSDGTTRVWDITQVDTPQITSEYCLPVLAGTDIVGCDFSGAHIFDDNLQRLIIANGGSI